MSLLLNQSTHYQMSDFSLDYKERRMVILNARRCFNCFKTNHNAFKCLRQDKKRCESCQLIYHRMIACPQQMATGYQPTATEVGLLDHNQPN